jgi:hypothetical protein
MILLLASGQALAGKPEADACAANLQGDARTIYDATAKDVVAGVDLRAVVRKSVTDLVMQGIVAQSTAKPNAQAAGKCLFELM